MDGAQLIIQVLLDILPMDPPPGRIKSRGFLAHFDELEDESSSPFCYHPDAERIWEDLHKQRFKTRKDALEAIQIAREIRSQDYLPASSSSQ